MNVASVGPTAAEAAITARDREGPFASIGDFMERTGLLQEPLNNLADAGAFDSLVEDRRTGRWEIGLRYRPVNSQLALPMPITQDMVELPELTPWERMDGEYRTMGLHPSGHIMAYLRDRLGSEIAHSQKVVDMEDGAEVTVAGLVIRRQRPLGKAVFITLEDEFGHIPLIIWPAVYERYRRVISEPLVMAHGTVSRRGGTMNIAMSWAKVLADFPVSPKAKNWQ